MKKTGLLGNNIKYSKSPEIHNKYYLERNIPLFYELFDMDEKHIGAFINNLRNENIIGFNVTIPYKQTIIKYLSSLVYPADKIGAVNTVVVEDTQLVGHNTDYYGFIKSLESYNINLYKKKALVLGAGGAAKAIVYALKDLNCKSIVIAARNIKKLDTEFKAKGKIVSIFDFMDLSDFDIIINCTPLGSANHKSSVPIELSNLKKDCIVYDLIYSPEKTEFLKKAESLGAFIINGERMLIYQAYSAADIWISKIKT